MVTERGGNLIRDILTPMISLPGGAPFLKPKSNF
jgi:hypothetical protein